MKISVITVVYNGEKTIERTIQSVIEQKNVDIEYIIVDGSSTDRTMEYVRKYTSHIAEIVSEPDRGIYDAMNKGSRLATGDIIAFLNSDDWYEKDTLQNVIARFENSEMDILCADARVISEYGNRIRRAELDKRTVFRRLPTSHQAIFTTRKWFEKIGEFDTNYIVSADFEWMTRSIMNSCKTELLHQVVVNFLSGGFSAKYSELCYQEIKRIAFQYYSGTFLESEMKKYYMYEDFIRTNEACMWQGMESFERKIKERVPLTKSVYIFGIGKVGVECFKMLRKSGYSIAGFVDNHPPKGQKEFMGKIIQSIENLEPGSDYIIIASTKYENDIMLQVEGYGFQKKRDFDLYTELKDCLFDE